MQEVKTFTTQPGLKVNRQPLVDKACLTPRHNSACGRENTRTEFFCETLKPKQWLNVAIKRQMKPI